MVFYRRRKDKIYFSWMLMFVFVVVGGVGYLGFRRFDVVIFVFRCCCSSRFGDSGSRGIFFGTAGGRVFLVVVYVFDVWGISGGE